MSAIRPAVGAVLAVLLLAAASPWAQVAAPGAPRSIAQVAGDLYIAKNDTHNTVFYVTPQGIVLGDPIDAAFSQWLRGELARRFPNRPVRFVLHSHHHFDHASGAGVWDDTAEIIAHENFTTELKASAAARPDMYNGVRRPEATFKDRRRITLGGRTVDVVAVGPNHSLDMAVLHFPDERAVFAVDFITVRKRFPGGLTGGAPLPAWIDAIQAVEKLGFDTIVPGHGEVGTRADVAAYRGYLQDLARMVEAGIKQRQTVEQLQASSALDKYKDWVNYPQGKNRNIADAYGVMRDRAR